MIGIEANGILVEELPIDDIALFLVETQHLVRGCEHERHVGAVAHRNPIRVEHLSGRVVQRIDADELGARLFGLDEVVRGRTGSRPCRIRGVHDDVLRVREVEAIVRLAAIGGRQADHVAAEGVRSMRGGIPSAHASAHHVDSRIGRLAVETRRAVFVADALDLLAGKLDRLVPADALPLVPAAHRAVRILTAAGLPPFALQRIENAVGPEALLLLGFTAHASALLGELGRILVRVIGLLANNRAFFHHDLVHAPTAAVMPTRGRHPGASLLRIHRRRGLFVFLDLRRRRASESRERCSRCRNRHASLHELSATQIRRGHANLKSIHVIPLL